MIESRWADEHRRSIRRSRLFAHQERGQKMAFGARGRSLAALGIAALLGLESCTCTMMGCANGFKSPCPVRRSVAIRRLRRRGYGRRNHCKLHGARFHSRPVRWTRCARARMTGRSSSRAVGFPQASRRSRGSTSQPSRRSMSTSLSLGTGDRLRPGFSLRVINTPSPTVPYAARHATRPRMRPSFLSPDPEKRASSLGQAALTAERHTVRQAFGEPRATRGEYSQWRASSRSAPCVIRRLVVRRQSISAVPLDHGRARRC